MSEISQALTHYAVAIRNGHCAPDLLKNYLAAFEELSALKIVVSAAIAWRRDCPDDEDEMGAIHGDNDTVSVLIRAVDAMEKK